MANNGWLVLTLIVVSHRFVSSFNLDGKDPFIYSGTSGEYFGYSVALHAQSNGKRWVVVGAPLGNNTSPFSPPRNRHGSVYRCDSSSSTQCTVIIVEDRSAYTTTWKGQTVPSEELTGQWLGATIISSPSDSSGPLMVCAPRYTYFGEVDPSSTPQDRNRQLLGKCFLVRNDLISVTQSAIQPCSPKKSGYTFERDGTCSVGFSAAMSSVRNIQTFLLGLPGRYKSDGSIAVIFSDDQTNPILSSVRDKDLGNVLGYAVAIGRFSSPKKEEFLASSTRANNLQGKVVAFRLDGGELVVSFTLPVPKDPAFQNGSSFGQSLCAVDLNSDGYSDLLVSAPYHRHDIFGDEGRVYVYINNGANPGPPLSHMPALTLDGEKIKRSLFGFAMAVAGDLNRDGYPEVAISAPYGGKDQGGVVYIFSGTKDGISTKPRQKIEASDISAGVKTFGYSLAGNLDVDGNSYDDLAIGAYSSDKAFLLRSRSIVNIQSNITLSAKEISLEDNSTLQMANDGVLRQSINVTVCLKFENQIPNPSYGWANVTYSVELDKDREEDYRRIFFLQGDKASFKIIRHFILPKENEWSCDSQLTVYLRQKEKIQSAIYPLTYDLVYDLVHSSSCILCPILNDYDNIERRSLRATTDFIKQCGPDKVCEPDLSVQGEVLKFGANGQEHKDLHVGDDNQMTVRVVVENKAQDAAYPGRVIVTFPSIIDYASSSEDVLCSRVEESQASDQADVTKVECTVGNPFRKIVKTFDVKFDTDRVTGNISELIIHLEATSPSKDPNPSDNKDTLKVVVKFEADLSISGMSIPDQVVYNDQAFDVINAIDVGPSSKTIMTVKNNGPSPVEYAEVTILLPFKNKTVEEEKNYVLYLMDLQVLENAGRCDVKTNPLNLPVGNSSQDSVSSKTSNRELENEELPCEYDSSLICLKVPCYLGRMVREDQVQIQMTTRLWQNTLIKADAGLVTISTTAKVIPAPSVPEILKDNNIDTIQLTAHPKTPPVTKGKTAPWIIVVAVLGGLALLALVGIALLKCGFFKRKRFQPEHTEEELTPMRPAPAPAV